MTIAPVGRLASSACVAAMLAACGGSPTANAVPPQSGVTSAARNDAGDCPIKHCIIVTSQNGYKNKPLPAVLFFARNANGNVEPAGEISGSHTMLTEPYGLAMDSQNNIYVANINNTITVYAAGSQGNVAPIRTIAGKKTKLNGPGGLAVDSEDELYVGNSPNHTVGSDQRVRVRRKRQRSADPPDSRQENTPVRAAGHRVRFASTVIRCE